MKIIELRAENTKILKAVRIRPEGNTVVIGGEEAQGKSTVLDCIELGLRGPRAMASVPIRTGQTGAKVELDIGENGEVKYTLERKMSASGPSMVLRSVDGAKVARPQEMLDGWTGICSKIAFRPLDFADQKPDDQAETLRKLVGVEFGPLDAQIAKIEADRLLVGRDGKNAAGYLDGLATVPEGTPDEEVSVSELLGEKAKSDEVNARHARAVSAADTAEREAKIAGDAVATEERKLTEARAALEAAKLKAQELFICAESFRKIADEAPTADSAPIVEKMRNAETVNRAVRAKKERAQKSSEVAALKARYVAMTDQIKNIEKQKTDMLAKVKWPIDGLGFGANGIVYQGLPFEQASKGQRYRVSIAVGMALNPELRVMLLPDAAVLSKSAMQAVEEMAKDKDYQVWIERVGDGDKGAIIMVDGEVSEPKAAT